MEMPRNCGNCDHFDGSAHCGLRYPDGLVRGYIVTPTLVVCAKWTKQETETKE